MDLAALKTELDADSLGRGYSGMDDVQAADDLNTVYRTKQKDTLSGSDIFNAVDPTEYSALTDTQRQHLRDVFTLGDSIDVKAGTNTRTVLLSLFGAGTTTRANLLAVVMRSASREDELFGERVTPSHVADARRLP